MVTGIIPGAAGANALGADMRFARGQPALPQRRDDAGQGDRVELSAATIAQARESVRAGMAQVHEALAIGTDAQAMLVNVQAAAREGDQEGLDTALQTYTQRLEAAIERGARLVAGEDVVVQAEPGGAPVTISGADLRLSADILSMPAGVKANDPALPQSAQKSMESLQEAMTRLVDSARSLEAHQGFLGAAEAAASVRDLDADGARLLALQVRQGLEVSGQGAIANVEPQAVLSLFRA